MKKNNRTKAKLIKSAAYLAKMFGNSGGYCGQYFFIHVEPIDEKDSGKALTLKNFLNVRYNQLYHKL